MNRLAAPFLTFAGLTAALLLLAALGVASSSPPAPPTPLPSNMELLGTVTTVVDKDDKLVAELKADDARRDLEHRDDWQ